MLKSLVLLAAVVFLPGTTGAVPTKSASSFPSVSHLITQSDSDVVTAILSTGHVVSLTVDQYNTATEAYSEQLALAGEVELEVVVSWTDSGGVKYEVKTIIYKNDSAAERLAKLKTSETTIEFLKKLHPPKVESVG